MGFRPLRVVAKVRESSTITSFHLEPATPDGWRPFEPGQYLSFRLPVAGPQGATGADSVLRHYSLSGPADAVGRYRISVKREPAAGPGLPAGLGSNHLHDRVEVGDLLQAAGPHGEFVLDQHSQRSVVLISGGVGLTPLVSMLHALATGSARPVYFIHACDNGQVHALGDEVAALVARRPGLVQHVLYRAPSPADQLAARHQGQGLVTRELLRGCLPLDDHEVYLCGPPPFMQAVYPLLRSLGLARERIAYEFFGPATVLEHEPAATVAAQIRPAPSAATLPEAGTIRVGFQKTGCTVPWRDGTDSLLELAEAQGLTPPFSCRAGVCGSCRTGLVSGRVAYFEQPLDDPGAHAVLLCCARPAGDVVLDL